MKNHIQNTHKKMKKQKNLSNSHEFQYKKGFFRHTTHTRDANYTYSNHIYINRKQSEQ